MKNSESNRFPSLDTMDEDALERQIGLLLDGRLDEATAESLRTAIAASPRAREVHDSLAQMLRALRTAPLAPHPSRDLLGKTFDRVAAARSAQEREARVLPWIRGVAIAAALVIGANTFMFRSVSADSDVTAVPTVEDHLRPQPEADRSAPDSISDYLAWYFLRRER